MSRFRKGTYRLLHDVAVNTKKTYRHQMNKPQVEALKTKIREMYEKIDRDSHLYSDVRMPPLQLPVNQSHFNQEFTDRLKEFGFALYSTYIFQTKFRVLYSTNYTLLQMPQLTPIYIRSRHFPFLEAMITDLKLVACPIFAYYNVDDIVPAISDSLIMVYLDPDVSYVCDNDRHLIYIPQYTYVSKSPNEVYKLSQARPEGWQINTAFGRFDDPQPRPPLGPPLGPQHRQPLGPQPGHRPRVQDRFSNTLNPFLGGRRTRRGGNHFIDLKELTKKEGMLRQSHLKKYKRIIYKLYWVNELLQLIKCELLHLHMVQGVYIKALGYLDIAQPYAQLFNNSCPVTNIKMAGFTGYITDEQQRHLMRPPETQPTWGQWMWRLLVSKQEVVVRQRMVFLCRKYISERRDTLQVTGNLIFATYNQTAVNATARKLSALNFDNLSTDEQEEIIDYFEYIDYPVTIGNRHYNALDFLTTVLRHELDQDSIIVQPFVAIEIVRGRRTLVQTLTPEQIKTAIEGPPVHYDFEDYEQLLRGIK